jgi:hypothetical protein
MKATTIGATIRASQKFPVHKTSVKPKYAPSIHKDPWARLTTPITPKIRERLEEINIRMDPMVKP